MVKEYGGEPAGCPVKFPGTNSKAYRRSYSFQVNQELLNQIFTKFHLNKEDYGIELTEKLLKGYLDKKVIQCVDLLDRFKDVSKTTSLYR